MESGKNIRILIYEAFLPHAFKIENLLRANQYTNIICEREIKIVVQYAIADYPHIIIVANKYSERKDVDLLYLLKEHMTNVPVMIFTSGDEYNEEITTTYKNVLCINKEINQVSLIEAVELIATTSSK